MNSRLFQLKLINYINNFNYYLGPKRSHGPDDCNYG